MSVAARYTTTRSAMKGPTGTRAPESEIAPVAPRLSFTVLLAGILTVLVAAWGGFAPFVGPEFGFVADRTRSFTPSHTNIFLAIIPAAVAVGSGLVIIGAARSTWRVRPDLWLLGALVALCGAWFAMGQYAWTALGGSPYLLPAGTHAYLAKQFGFTVGVGLVLVLLGAITMGWSQRRRPRLARGPYPRAVPGTGAPPAPPV